MLFVNSFLEISFDFFIFFFLFSEYAENFEEDTTKK